MTGWISVLDKVPQWTHDVLVCNQNGEMFVAYFDPYSSIWYIRCLCKGGSTLRAEDVMHWMPLPTTPDDQHLFHRDKPGEFEGIEEDANT